MAADENNAFDELMAQMGVRRLESGSKSPRAKGRRGRPQKAAPPTRAMRDAMVKASAPASPPAPAQPPAPAAPGVDVEQLRAELRRARSAAQEARDRADATEAERARLAEANAVLDAERRGLQRRLQAALGDAPVPMPSLAEAFKARGVLGEHEAGKALVALVEARRTGSLLSLLEASDGKA
ncbi:MAG: hypothetical protein VX000_05650, partial [Myxococcota bacterium]|nr:hypothetical protein [Myxococcota bacterium]